MSKKLKSIISQMVNHNNISIACHGIFAAVEAGSNTSDESRVEFIRWFLTDHFFALFLHWSSMVRGFFHHFLMYNCFRLRRRLLPLSSDRLILILASKLSGERAHEDKDIVELEPVLSNASVPVSIGHFAYQPATAGINADGFKTLLRLVKDGNTWIKISGANRVSETDLPPYDDVLPMARALVEANPDNVMWGTDWPHPNKYEVNPNDGDLVNWFGEWITDDAMRTRIMVDNSEAFYDFGAYQG